MRSAFVAALLLAALAPPLPAAAADTWLEAETGVLNGTVVESSLAGYSGTGYVAGFDESSDSVTITIPGSPGGLHDLTIRYATPYGAKTASLSLNGSGLGDVSFPAISTFAEIVAGKALLRPGDNTLTITNNWGWYLIDAIKVAPSPPRPPHQVTGELTDSAATAEAKGLMRYLTDNYGKNTVTKGEITVSASDMSETASYHLVVEPTGGVPSYQQRYEAENASVFRAERLSAPSASNGGYVGRIDNSGDARNASYVDFIVNVPTVRSYTMTVSYANGTGATATQGLAYNGGP